MIATAPGRKDIHGRKIFEKSAWRLLASALPEQKGPLFLIMLGTAFQGSLVIPATLIIRFVIDNAIVSATLSHLLLSGAALLFLRFAAALTGLAVRARTIQLNADVISRVRNEVVDHFLFAVPRRSYTVFDTARMHDTVVQDTSRLDRLLNALIAGILPAAMAAAILFPLLLVLSWQLTLLLFLLFPASVAATRFTGKKVRRSVRNFQKSFESYSKNMLFILQQLELIRLHAAEKRESVSKKGGIRVLARKTFAMSISYAQHAFVHGNILSLFAIAVLTAGGILVSRNILSLGTFLAFFVVANIFNGYISRGIDALPDVIAGNESLVKLDRLLKSSQPMPYSGAKELDFKGIIQVREVTFGYLPNLPPLFEDFSLKLEPGLTVGITGTNGTGKTTLVRLILGLHRPWRGELQADGHPYDELDLSIVRRMVGVVPQNPSFFTGTLLDNIIYGCPGANRETVDTCLRSADAEEFIAGLPNGYHTRIGEGGIRLSGGQRQRLAIARALINEPKILVLDEATVHLDIRACRTITYNLRNLPQNPGVLMIGHTDALHALCDVIRDLDSATVAS